MKETAWQKKVKNIITKIVVSHVNLTSRVIELEDYVRDFERRKRVARKVLKK